MVCLFETHLIRVRRFDGGNFVVGVFEIGRRRDFHFQRFDENFLVFDGIVKRLRVVQNITIDRTRRIQIGFIDAGVGCWYSSCRRIDLNFVRILLLLMMWVLCGRHGKCGLIVDLLADRDARFWGRFVLPTTRLPIQFEFVQA